MSWKSAQYAGAIEKRERLKKVTNDVWVGYIQVKGQRFRVCVPGTILKQQQRNGPDMVAAYANLAQGIEVEIEYEFDSDRKISVATRVMMKRSPTREAIAPQYSVWLLRSSLRKDVPAGAFMPDRTYVPGSSAPWSRQVSFDIPVNVGVIKGNGEVVLFDTGWKQSGYLKMTNSINWAPLPKQLEALGIEVDDVTKIVLGDAHWDHAGQIDDFPGAVLFVQREELRGIEWALNYPNPRIRAVNTSPGGCLRTPACGFPPLTVDQIYSKALKGQAVIVDGEMEITPGLSIHPAYRAHSAGSQLLQVNTSIGQILFGGGAYSSWEGVRDWLVANIQQTDTVQQFLAYEKCYKITGGYENCVAAHEPLSYSDRYPLTKNWWAGPNDSRIAEVALEAGEKSRRP